MPDVRRLVRVDRGVLDDRFAGGRVRLDLPLRQTVEEERPAFEEEVQVAVRCCRYRTYALERSERAGDLLSDRSRRLPQAPGQLERHRGAEVAELAVGRI